jgi:hypothetical protein
LRCPDCGEDHGDLEPAFRRPDVIAALSATERRDHAKESDDLCALRGDDGVRFFVRCVLRVRLVDVEDDTHWGLWAEIDGDDFQRILELWSDPVQATEPPKPGRIANRVRGYADTIGLPVLVRLTGPTSRPLLELPADSAHPFAVECLAGVKAHRVAEWLARVT